MLLFIFLKFFKFRVKTESTKMQPKITIGNVCFIVDEQNDKILLLKRSKEPLKDKYTGVGGKTNLLEDIRSSCIREAKEETGLDLKNIQLKGVIKTILKEENSSWILFVYFSNQYTGDLICSPEGILQWFDTKKIFQLNLIGFIRKTLDLFFKGAPFLEGTIEHDKEGNILKENLLVKEP